MDKSKNFWGDTGEGQSFVSEFEEREPVREQVIEVSSTPIHVQDTKPVMTSMKPEEVELKKKNKKDLLLITCIVGILIVAIAAGTLFLYNSGTRKIYSLIDSGSYALAAKEICDLYERGENVDTVALDYITVCMNEREYKRVVQIMPVLSDEAYADIYFYCDIILYMLDDGKEVQAEAVAKILYERGYWEEAEAILLGEE